VAGAVLAVLLGAGGVGIALHGGDDPAPGSAGAQPETGGRELSSGHSSPDHPVVLLKSTDYGKRQIKNGHFLWVTFALGDFPSAPSVTAWCDSEFSDLSTAERENQCAARRHEP
jgi:hypothetical protein